MEQYTLVPTNVVYTNKSRVHNRAIDLYKLTMEYAKSNPKASVAQIVEMSLSEPFRRRLGILNTVSVASLKHSDWKHEDEIRILAGMNQAIPILSSVLKRVFFTKWDFPGRTEIMELLHEHYPNVGLVEV